MRGMVFTEFMAMVEDQFGFETLDTVITDADLPNQGAYSSVGAYDHKELVRMVMVLSRLTEIEASTLISAFGKYLFGRFAKKYPTFFEGPETTFEFLETVEETVHVEVLKLYPDAELPSFDFTRKTDDTVHMVYRSKRCFADLAQGLMEGCADHYGETLEIDRRDMPVESGSHVLFELQHKAA